MDYCGDSVCSANQGTVEQYCQDSGSSPGDEVILQAPGIGPCLCYCPGGNSNVLARFWRRLRLSFSNRVAPKQVRRERLTACAACPNAMARATGGGVCALCGCAVRLKAMVAGASCPAGRWQAA